MNLVFASKAPKQHREALEDLLFFNPQQAGSRSGIVKSVAKFGQPRLVETGGNLTLKIGELEAQTLFAYDESFQGTELAGVVVFLRTSPAEVAIMHIAVSPDYGMQSEQAGMGLGVVLIEKVKEICQRIVGVERIILSYRNDIAIRLRAPQS